ncbi:MAG: 4'-phosphopantetheinyl transferase superfamily protein [Clostridiales Family XIII bacterium]|jgi:phosphopantetheine--protein transferase-like protein|nr:4'-phosphopantetheinyl transferase superfamily protein [Clostridiales Family XIII bacterium]
MNLYLHEIEEDKTGNPLAWVCERYGQTDHDIRRGAHGKPSFADPMLKHIHFSISHSGRYWAVLIGSDEVGLDIEDTSARARGADRLRRIGERFFAADEANFLWESETDAALAERFYRIWTAKEAYVKFTGEGLTRGLNTFSILDLSAVVPAATASIGTKEIAEGVICSCCAAQIFEFPEVIWVTDREKDCERKDNV